MSKFNHPPHLELRSKSSADLRIKNSRQPTVVEVSSIPVPKDPKPAHIKSTEPAGSKVVYRQFFDSVNSPTDYTHLGKKSITRSATRTSSVIPPLKSCTSGEINLPSFRKITIESLTHLPSGSIMRGEVSPTTPGPVEETKNVQRKSEGIRNKAKVSNIQELLKNKTELITLRNLQAAIETVSKTFSQAKWFIADGRKQASENMQYIEKLLLVSAESLAKTFDKYKSENDEFKAVHSKITSKTQDLVMSERKFATENKKLKETERRKDEERVYYETKESNWRIEKARLETLLEDMRLELQRIKPLSNVKQIYGQFDQEKAELQAKIESLAKDNHKKGVRVIKLEHQVGQLKEEIYEKDKFVNEFSQIRSKLENQISNHQKKTQGAQNEAKMLREQVYMLGEELRYYIQIHSSYKELKQTFEALRKRYQFLEVNVISTIEEARDETKYFADLDDPIFTKIRKASNESLPHLHRHMSDIKHIHSEPSTSYTEASFNLSQLKLPRPSFASFLHFHNHSKASYILPYENWLEVTVRGILDSKYYEHQVCNTALGRTPSRFPEFVFSWLGNFIIDESTRSVKELDWWRKDRADDARKLLLYALTQEPSKRVWEINTFREFLMEDLMLDELGFYLHCRFLLFDGPQLGHSAARYKHIHYINLEKALEVVDTIMSNLPSSTLEELLNILKERSKKRVNILYIESCFVLRVLLEYYRQEKIQRYKAIKEVFNRTLFDDMHMDKNHYSSFVHACKNLFPSLSDIQVAKFYRDLHAMTDGNISPEAFFIVADELGYLYNNIHLKGLYRRPIVNSDGVLEESTYRFVRQMQNVYKEWLRDQKSYEITKEAINSMGVSEIKHYMVKLDALLSCKHSIPSEEYRSWNLSDIYRQLWLLISMSQTAFFHFNFQACITLHGNLEDLPFLKIRAGCEEFIDTLYLLHIKRVTTRIMARKIQKKWREKAKRNLNVITTVLQGVSRFKLPITHNKAQKSWLGIPILDRS